MAGRAGRPGRGAQPGDGRAGRPHPGRLRRHHRRPTTPTPTRATTPWSPNSPSDPEATRAGHGSRLLNAVVDTIRADGFRRVTVWVNSTDDVLRAFYTDSGWAPDGAHRELDLYGDESVRIKQIRLHTDPGTE